MGAAIVTLLADRVRRHCLKLLCAATATVAFRLLRAQPAASGRDSVLQFGADPTGRQDSSAAFRAAIAYLDVVLVPAGDYMVGDIELRTGITLSGEGERSVLRQRVGARYVLHADSGSTDPVASIKRITVQNLQLRGTCDSTGFSQFIHLVSLNGVDDVLFESVIFRGFRGDGLYLGSSDRPNTERHNRRVTIRGCLFDGINKENRNGLSVIDCELLVVERCEFIRIARADMPGAIDIEPNSSPWHVIRHLRIEDNRFIDIGGGIGAICMFVPAALAVLPTDLSIARNTIDGVAQAAFSLRQAVPTAPGMTQNFAVRDNQVRGAFQRPFVLYGISGIELSGNHFDGATQAALIGHRDPISIVREVVLRNNHFQRCGRDGGVGVSVFHVAGLRIESNEFQDCGNGSPSSYVFDFNAGRSERVQFLANRFLSPMRKSRFAIQKEPAHQFTRASNFFAKDNVIESGLRNQFESDEPR